MKSPKIDGVQWQTCGLGSAYDGKACAAVITSQVLGPLQIVLFIATLPAGGAGGAAAGAAAKSTSTVAKVGQKV